ERQRLRPGHGRRRLPLRAPGRERRSSPARRARARGALVGGPAAPPSPRLMSLPRRRVVQAEALAWLADNPAEPGSSVVTSLPDLSEMPERGLEGWRSWFVGAARQVLRWVPAEGAAIFFQSDIR